MEIEDLMQLKVDLSLITDDELEALAAQFGRFEKEFKEDPPVLGETFQKLNEILRSETIARQAGIASEGLQRFYLLPKEVFSLSDLIVLTRAACRLADAKTSRSHFGMALLVAILA